MKTYKSFPQGGDYDHVGMVVVLSETDPGQRPLEGRHDLANHSPDGFAWGYGGSGPAQLALAILADALQDDQLALSLYQRYKFAIIAPLGDGGFEITEESVLRWVIKTIAGNGE